MASRMNYHSAAASAIDGQIQSSNVAATRSVGGSSLLTRTLLTRSFLIAAGEFVLVNKAGRGPPKDQH